jgi:hypothetical protein
MAVCQQLTSVHENVPYADYSNDFLAMVERIPIPSSPVPLRQGALCGVQKTEHGHRQ